MRGDGFDLWVVGGQGTWGFALYAEQFTGSASEEKRETLGRRSRTACQNSSTERKMERIRPTFIPRLVRNMLQAVQLRIHTLCATGGKGLWRWSGTGIGLTFVVHIFICTVNTRSAILCSPIC